MAETEPMCFLPCNLLHCEGGFIWEKRILCGITICGIKGVSQMWLTGFCIKGNAEEKQYENDNEWLCKVKKTDKLSPIYTICLYYGEEPWDGPRSLKDMMDFGEDGDVLSRYFADYPMRLVCLNEQEGFEEFQTEVRKVFRLMSLRKNRKLMQKEFETNPDYRDVDIETVENISVMLDAPEIWEHRSEFIDNEEREGNDMCQAIREMLEDARTEGRTEGILDNIRKMMKHMKITVEEALNVLEIPENEREHYLRMMEGVYQ